MLTPQYLLPIHNELVVDLFAGGGGASTGIELAIGRAVDVAINHDAEAISLHTANHPQTQHFCSDVFEVDPVTVTQGQPVGLLWASPDCKHFSKAKGGKPVSKKIRSLAWVVVKWAKAVRPRMIFLENVEEFQTWGPLTTDNLPDPLRKGDTFRQWKGSLEKLGYVVEHRELRACDYGAPTIRKRLFLVARRDGLPIVWPEPTHAAPASLAVKAKKLKPWRTAAECIDWSIPAPSIFERKKPLAEATCRRIAKGIIRYVVQSPNPFIVSTLIRAGQSPRVPGLDKPIGTLVGSQKHALVSAFLAKHYTGVVGSDMAAPVATVTSVDHHSLVTAHITKFNTGSTGFAPDTPMHTITAGGLQARPGTAITQGVVTSNLVKMRGDNVGSATDEPLHTISAQGTHHAEVRAFLIKYYGTDQDPALRDPLHTVTTKDRFGLVTIKGEDYQIVDIGLRMLTPRELYRAQGFPQGYQIDFGAAGEPLTKTAQVRMCGNSVCPPLSQAIVRANYAELAQKRMVA
jgi:DNA (cytosine-5)-methyltransferase 1